MNETIKEKTYEYIHNEEIGMGVFDIIRLPDGELLFSFKDKHGYFNIFTTMEDFLAYMGVNGLIESDHVSFPDEYPFPDDPDYEEGVDALDLYLRSLA